MWLAGEKVVKQAAIPHVLVMDWVFMVAAINPGRVRSEKREK